MVCKFSATFTSLENYYFDEHNVRTFEEPLAGLSNIQIEVIDDVLICSFTRDNMNAVKNYFSIDETIQTRFIGVYGELTSNFVFS